MTERDAWLAGLPKAELHLHLEGAIPLPALFELVQAAGGDPAVPTVEALRDRLVYPDFPAFLDAWIWKNSFLRTYDDFAFMSPRPSPRTWRARTSAMPSCFSRRAGLRTGDSRLPASHRRSAAASRGCRKPRFT